MAFLARSPADAVMALALVHHLANAGNDPFPLLAGFLSRAGRWLVVEFAAKGVPQGGRLLAGRRDIFDVLDKAGIEAAFGAESEVMAIERVEGNERDLYLMRRRGEA